MCKVLCLVSLSESVFWGWWSLSLWKLDYPFLCISSPNHRVLFSSVGVSWWLSPSARQVLSVAKLCPYQSFVSLCYRCVARLCMLYKINSNSNRLFSELPYASTRVWPTRAAAAAHPLKFEVSRCTASEFARYFLPEQVRMWNDLPNTVFDTGPYDMVKGAVNRSKKWKLFNFFVAQVFARFQKQVKRFFFHLI